jgi:hypothetical protein
MRGRLYAHAHILVISERYIVHSSMALLAQIFPEPGFYHLIKYKVYLSLFTDQKGNKT